MGEWLIELKGDELSLSKLAANTSSLSHQVIERDCVYYLKPNESDGLSSEDTVYSYAKDFLPVLNGAASLYIAGYQNVGLTGRVDLVDEAGKRRRHLHHSTSSYLVLSDTVIAEGGSNSTTGPTNFELAMTEASKEEVVVRALKFFSSEKNWFNLYKILDAIRDDFNKSLQDVIDQGWASKDDITRFTGTANNHTAAQGEARHGFDFGKPMSNPMTLGEAEQLIRTMLTSWLSQKTKKKRA